MNEPPAGSDRRPVLIYDGACGFCLEQVARLRRFAKDRIRYESFREPGVLERYPELDPRECEAAAQLVVPRPPGPPMMYSGAAALVRAAMKSRLLRIFLWPYLVLPPVRWAADSAYRWIAANRFRLLGSCGKDDCPAHGKNRGSAGS